MTGNIRIAKVYAGNRAGGTCSSFADRSVELGLAWWQYKYKMEGKQMTFKELPQKWKNIIIGLRVTAIVLFILLITNIWTTLGPLMMVMF